MSNESSQTNAKQTSLNNPHKGHQGFPKGNTVGNRFKPGQTGNPNGRRGSLRDIFEAAFADPDPKTGKSPRDVALQKLTKMCHRGNLKAIRTWLEWGLGKPPTEINLGGQAKNPLSIQPVFNCVPEAVPLLKDILTGKKPDVCSTESKQPDEGVHG
jgi:hypothetical protein